jgi:glycosyltransferase involved in cell wall biosynthesis
MKTKSSERLDISHQTSDKNLTKKLSNFKVESNRDYQTSLAPQSTLSFFTICAQNYLAFAIVLGKSLSETISGARLTVFILDGVPDDTSGMDHLDLRGVASVIEPDDWVHRRIYYNILELSTSVKPACFLQMIKEGHQFVVYLDPDILVLKPLDDVVAAFEENQEVVLIPHTVKPFPNDKKRPGDLDILRSGIYNLGFAAFRNSQRSIEILTWWDEKLRTLCLSDPREGVFTDQKWMDYLPAFEKNVHILRHPGYNVAYWNIHERQVTIRNDLWSVSQADDTLVPLVFYHFSGFHPDRHDLSKYQDRYEGNLPGDLKILLADYAAQLKASGFDHLSARPIPEVRFKTGEVWDPICRLLYREVIKTKFKIDNPLEDDRFISWMGAHEPGDHLSRYLRTLLRYRDDLAIGFNDGRDIKGLLNWLHRHGKTQTGIDENLLVRLGLVNFHGDSKGVNFVGYLRTHMGIAQAARGYLESITSAGIPVSTFDISETAIISGTVKYPQGDYTILQQFPPARELPYNLTLLHVNADQLPSVFSKLPPKIQNTFNIGVWAWETMNFPEDWCDRFDLVDEIWVASQFMAEAVRAKATVPVVVIPHAVMPPRADPDRLWLSQLIPDIREDEFLFLFQFDTLSVPYRKNPEGTIKAFVEAFTPDEPVRLIVKTLNADRADRLIEDLNHLSSGHRVSILDCALSDADRFRMLATVDSFVSLHRAEGFGLSIAEAMAYGKPVIATNWSGNIDFMDEDTAVPVAFTLKQLDRQHGPYAAGTIWAEPDISDATRLMRKVYASPVWRKEIGETAARRISEMLSNDTIGTLIKLRLERIITSQWFFEKCQSKRQNNPQRSMMKYFVRNIFERPSYFIRRVPKAFRFLKNYGIRATIQQAWLHMK